MRRSSSLHSIDTFVDRKVSNEKYQDVVTVAENIDAITTINTNIAEMLILAGMEVELLSIYADKATLDSLYADKATLDSLYTDKATLDSLFADKTILDSLYDDKAALDTLYTNLASIILVAGSISDINDIADQIVPNITEILQADDNAVIVTTLYDLFDDRFLGAIASDPALDNDGDALVEGTLYWNTTDKILKIFNGVNWEYTAVQLVDNLTTDDNTKALASSQGVVIGNRLDAIEITFNDTNEPTGFIRAEPLTTGIIEISDDGTIIHRVDSNGIYSTSIVGHNGYDPNIVEGEFYDGTAATARTFQISPVSIADGGDGTYIVYNQGNRIVVNQSQQVQLPATTGLYTAYHNSEGVLDYIVGFDLHSFTDYTITSIIYGNASTGELVIFGDERHGIQMDGMTHRYLHYNEGFRYSSGSDILGLVDGESTFDEITSGAYYDEDIYHTLPAQTEVPTLYISGDEWRVTAHPDLSNDVGYFVDGTVRYNQNLGTDIAPNYTLTAFASGDYMIVFLAATNNATHPYMRMLGQEVYASKALARAAIEDAWSDMHIVPGLPFPEFKPISAAIINGDGELVELSDGSLFFDLREVGTFGTGSSSASAQYHYDLLGRDTIDSHPATAISYDHTISELSATTVKDAIDEIDARVDTIEDDYLTSTDIGVAIQAYNDNNALTSDITYETLDTNGDVGTSAGQLAIGNHTHTGVYEPADSTILKDADIGSTVQGYDADTAKTDVAQTFTVPQRTSIGAEDNAIDFTTDNNFELTATAADITVGDMTGCIGQSGTITIDSAENVTGWGTEFLFNDGNGAWASTNAPTITGTEVFAYFINTTSTIRVGRVQ
jgi:hypothetical protein